MHPETPEDLNAHARLLDCVADHLAGGRRQSCRVVSCRRKLRKFILEFEIQTPDGARADSRRCIGKVYKEDRGQAHFDALARLRECGFCPPSPFTVPSPLAYFREERFLLQEKAPGGLLADIVLSESDGAGEAIPRAAGWLAALHASRVDASSRLDQIRTHVARYGPELAVVLPEQARRLQRLSGHAHEELRESRLTTLVPSHGDFHLKNVFVSESGRVTAIDLDTFGLQEMAADVAYFLAQAAILGRRRRGSFAATAWVREHFLQSYLNCMKALARERIGLYLGLAFLQGLHYDLCILRTGDTSIVELWLTTIERCFFAGETSLCDDHCLDRTPVTAGRATGGQLRSRVARV